MKHLFLFLLMVWAALGFCGCAVDASWQDGAVSGENESCPAARDLWIAGNNKLLDKTGIVYIKDANGTIMDAVVLNESPVETWNGNQPHFAEITESLCNAGMWQSADAVNTSAIGGSVYKSVSRYENKENTHSANDWYITIMGNYTPGQPNL